MEIEEKVRMRGECMELVHSQDIDLSEFIRDAGVAGRFAFQEFIRGQIRNRFTRKAHLHAVKRFSDWCAVRQLELVRITSGLCGGLVAGLIWGRFEITAVSHEFAL